MPETPKNSGSKHPEKDRRIHARQRVHSLSYVKIGEGNGGIVLNISEGGISVQAAAVLDDSESVPLWLEIPQVRERLKITGEIVWLSLSRKEAGLRFVDLPESALREIRRWMAREAAPEKFEEETEPVNEEQDVPVQAVEQRETAVLGPIEADIAVEEHGEGFESEPEMIAASTTAEEEVAAPEEDPAETTSDIEEPEIEETEIEKAEIEKAEIEEVPPVRVEADSAVRGAALTAKESETDEETEGESDPEETHETEDDLIKAFGPPVVPFERRPHAPFSSMSAISGGARSAQNLAIAPPVSDTFAQAFAEPPAMPTSATQSDSKGVRVQSQTGWFLAALVLLLALISFIAGMAVRRGVLNGVLGEQADSLVPKSAPAQDASVAPANSPVGGANVAVPPAKPMSIEIVDLANRRWVIPASTGVNHGNLAASPGSASQPSNPVADAETARTAVLGTNSQPQVSSKASGQPPANVSGASAATGAAKPNVPLVLSLPETPISASGSVAISSQRSVPVPPDGNQSAKTARSLQVGQLVNMVEPVYPPEAVQQKIEGTVKLHAVIGTDGVIESLAQVSGPQILVNASMAAVRNWKYSPTRMNGQAIETQEDISFVFRLPN
ncbi:MAG TPA: TonB family protein [Candidatus Acidoferrales bacterium]